MPQIDESRYFWTDGVIRLRPARNSDWPAAMASMYDSIGRFLFTDEIDLPVEPESYEKRHVDYLADPDRNHIAFVIETIAGEYAGIANLFGVDERHGIFGPIGIEVSPTHRGKGYALAALRILGRYMFAERRMHKWNSAYIDGNAASAALHARLGFKVEGVRRAMAYHDRRYWDHILVGITEDEFFENERLLNERTQA